MKPFFLFSFIFSLTATATIVTSTGSTKPIGITPPVAPQTTQKPAVPAATPGTTVQPPSSTLITAASTTFSGNLSVAPTLRPAVPAPTKPAVDPGCQPSVVTTIHIDKDGNDFPPRKVTKAQLTAARVPVVAYVGLFYTNTTPRHYIFGIITEYSDDTVDVTVMGLPAAGDPNLVLDVYNNHLKDGWTNTEEDILMIVGKENIAKLFAIANQANATCPNQAQRICLFTSVPFSLGYTKPCLVSASYIYHAVNNVLYTK